MPSSGGAFNSEQSAWGMATHPTVWTFAGVILAALIILALLRHFFGSIRVDAGTR
jgi:hypothetical protein